MCVYHNHHYNNNHLEGHNGNSVVTYFLCSSNLSYTISIYFLVTHHLQHIFNFICEAYLFKHDFKLFESKSLYPFFHLFYIPSI